MKMGIQFLIVPCLRRDKSGFPLKDCGNDRKYESVFATFRFIREEFAATLP